MPGTALAARATSALTGRLVARPRARLEIRPASRHAPVVSPAVVLRCLFSAALLIVPAMANAQTPPRVHWRLELAGPVASLRCPDTREFAERVGDHLGQREPFTSGAPNVVRVELTRAGRRVRGAYTVARDGQAASRPRAFLADDCGRVVDDLVRSIGLVLDPFALIRAETPSAPLPPPVATEAIPAPARERPPPIVLYEAPAPLPPSRPPPFHLDLALGGGAAFGGVSDASPSLSASAALAGARFSLGVELRADLSVTVAVPQVAGASFASSWFGGGLVPCATWSWLSACGALFVGAALREPVGVRQGAASTALVIFAGGRVAGTWSLSPRFAVMGHVDVLAPALQAVPSLQEGDHLVAVWTPWPVHLGVGARFVVRLR